MKAHAGGGNCRHLGGTRGLSKDADPGQVRRLIKPRHQHSVFDIDASTGSIGTMKKRKACNPIS
jgi:hypothetical protein